MQGKCHGAVERRLARDERALFEERTGGGNPYLYFVAQNPFMVMYPNIIHYLYLQSVHQVAERTAEVQGERVLSAGPIQVRRDSRMSLVEAASLRIKDVDVADAGETGLRLIIRVKLVTITYFIFALFNQATIPAKWSGGVNPCKSPTSWWSWSHPPSRPSCLTKTPAAS